MKKLLLCGMALSLAISNLTAQQNQGKVTYNRTVKLQMSFAGMPGGLEQQLPSSRTDKYELVFGNNQSLWKQGEQEPEEEQSFGDGGMQIRMVVAGSNDVLYCNFDNSRRVEKREMFDKTFIVDDTITKLK